MAVNSQILRIQKYSSQMTQIQLKQEKARRMKIALDIVKIYAEKDAHQGSIKVMIKMSDEVIMVTQKVHLRRGCYTFMEKHTITLPDDHSPYIQLILVSETNHPLAQITVFYNKFKVMNQITIESPEQAKYRLNYALEEKNRNSRLGESSVDGNRIEDDPLLKDQKNKLAILKMGLLIYKFMQRLDPLVFVCGKVRKIIFWENPFMTILVGLVLTLILFNLKLAILTSGILLYCCQAALFQKIQNIHKYKKITSRIMAPQQNALLFQNLMNYYCQLYQSLAQFFFRHDKTLLVEVIHVICKMSLFLFALLYFIPIEYIAVGVIWIVLLLTSPIKESVRRFIRSALFSFAKEYDKFVGKVKKEVKEIVGASRVKGRGKHRHARQFYLYHYQRWVLFKGWQQDYPKYADQNFEGEVLMHSKAPQGFDWVGSWQISKDTEMPCDQNGFQYSNDFVKYFSAQIGLANRRRRKWVRKCVKVHQ